MLTLHEYLLEYQKNKRAIAHFNVVTIDMLWGIFHAARSLSTEKGELIPVVVGVSEKERDFFGEQQFVDMVRGIRQQYEYPIFSNADHTMTALRAEQALDIGFDMIVIDGAGQSFEDNVDMVKQVVTYRNEKQYETLIEAELGFIGFGSMMRDTLPDGVSAETMTSPDQADAFVLETGIDALAPSVGNVHGMVRTGNPRLDEKRVHDIAMVVGIPLVLHGGSGSRDEDFCSVIKQGIVMIHISTELRKVYREALEHSLQTNTEIAPYVYLQQGRDAVYAVARSRMKLFFEAEIV